MSLLLRQRQFLLTCRSPLRPMSASTAAFKPLPAVLPPSEINSLLSSNKQKTDTSLPRVIALDASWFLPNDPQKRTGMTSFSSLRLTPDARFFDLDEVASHTSPYPHMIPTSKTFAEAMRELHIRRDDAVVLYESSDQGIYSAPRAAWTFKVFGHGPVTVLDNFNTWIKQGLSVAKPSGQNGEYSREIKASDEYPQVEPDLGLVASFEEVYEIAKQHRDGASTDKRVQILDARSRGRFTGEDPEPRPGVSSGHIPGSLSVPFGTLLDPETKGFLPRKKLRKVLEDAGVDPNPKVQKISMCGTGVTAVIIDTALQIAGFEETPESRRRVYDGSWTEWAQRVKEGEGMVVKDV